MSYPSKSVSDLMKWATPLGCTYLGVGGNGHVRIRLPNGEVYTTAATPSSHSSMLNARQDIARKLGVRAKQTRAGHFRKGMTQETRVVATVRVESRSSQVERLEREHRTVCDLIRVAQHAGLKAMCSELVTELFDTETAIRKLGQHPPLRTFRITP